MNEISEIHLGEASHLEEEHSDNDVEETWVCRRCSHESTTKSNLLSHLRRKKPCKITGEAVSIESYINELLARPQQEPKKYSCPSCNYQFNTRQSKSRHMKTCKVANKETTNTPQVPTQPVTQQATVNTATERNDDIIAFLIKKVEVLENLVLERDNKSRNGISNDTHFNTQITNNSTQININVNLNTFGQEDTSYLTPDFLSYCLLNPRKGMTSLIENIHYNKDYPNNQNLRCKSFKQNIFEKYVDSEWRACDASNTLDELIRKGYRILNAHYTENIMNDPAIFEDEDKQKIYEKFRFLGDTSCLDYFAVKREVRVLVKDRTMYLIASPEPVDNVIV